MYGVERRKYHITITTWHLLPYVDLAGHHQQIEVQNLLSMDNNRIEVENYVGEDSWVSSDSEEDNIGSVEFNAIKSLCGELMEEVYEEDSLHLSYVTKVVPTKCKSHIKPCLKRTCKIKLPKIPLYSVKWKEFSE